MGLLTAQNVSMTMSGANSTDSTVSAAAAAAVYAA